MGNCELYINGILWDIFRWDVEVGIVIKMRDSHVLNSGRLSPFFNFYPMGYNFSVDNVPYNSSEQYFQQAEPVFVNNPTVAMEIMLQNDLAIMKRMGDTLKTDKTDWDKVAPEMMKTNVYAKSGISNGHESNQKFANCGALRCQCGTTMLSTSTFGKART